MAALAVCALSAPLFTSCQSSNGLISLSESVPPKLAKNKPFLHVECFFVTCPADFQLMKETKGAHIAGIYSPQDGDNLIKSFKRKKGFAIHSAPSLTLRQGKSGSLETYQEFIYPTEYEPPQVDPKKGRAGSFPITPATPTEFETTNLGITVKFKGQRDKNGAIDFDIDLEHRAFGGFLNYGTPINTHASNAFGGKVEVTLTENQILMPIISMKKLATSVSLQDDHYVAIGGLREIPREDLQNKNSQAFANGMNGADKNLIVLIKVKGVDKAGN